MADAALIERCMEEIATTVLDAGDAISYRTLGASSQVSVDISRHALHKFAQENESSVGAIEVVVQQGVTSSMSNKKSEKISSSANAAVDPRARVIRIGSFSPEQSAEKAISKQIYSVYKKTAEEDESDAVEPISIACWSQERSLRNDIFQKVAKQAPLSRAIKSFYDSGIKCVEATTRTGFGDSQGEESVSVFDSLKATKQPSAFGSSAKSSSGSNSTQSGTSNGSKSFFTPSASATNTPKSRATSSASLSTRATPAAAKQPETKKIDATSMSSVFTIDSDDDDDDDSSDADAPVFVRKSSGTAASATTKPRSKRVISDDEDEDDEFVESSAKTPAPVAHSKKDKAASNSSSNSRNVKRKLSTSPDEKMSHVTLSDSDEESKRTKSIDEDDNGTHAEEEEEEEPAEISTIRRVEVTKTRINEQGYMVTEKTVEEVELTAEEIEQERLQAAKKKQQQQATKAAAEAANAAAEKKAAAAAKGGAPAKQKNLFAFFTRK